MIDDDKPSLDELEHHGVKGMRWGVRKKEDTSSGLSRQEQIIANHLAAQGIRSQDLQAKYGPGSLGGSKKGSAGSKDTKKGMSRNQKIIIAGAGIAAIGLGAYYGNKAFKSEEFGIIKQAMEGQKAIQQLQKSPFWKDYEARAVKSAGGLTPEGVAKLSTKEAHFAPGHIFKRCSMDIETEIKPGGFYAAAHPEDVEKYKAILPVYWKRWGGPHVDSGHIISLSSKEAVKAPSPRAMFDHFRGLLDSDPEARAAIGIPRSITDSKALDSAARRHWPHYNVNLLNENAYLTKKTFSHFKGLGYNALIDTNDAGVLAKQPMRMMDGKIFSIVGHEPLTHEAIQTAQKTLSDSITKVPVGV